MPFRYKVLLILAFILAVMVSSNAYAHPLLIESDPSNLQRLSSAPSRVIITFSEPVESRFSWIRVYDSSNNRVDNNDTGYVDGNPTRLGVTLQPLNNGIYTVNTRVLSQVDGHIVDYTFIFIVGDAALNGSSIEPARLSSEKIVVQDALAKFPAYLAQVLVIGLATVILYLWHINSLLKVRLDARRVYMLTLVAGIMLIASSIALAVIQSISLHTDVEYVFATRFGNLLLLRIATGLALLALAYITAKYWADALRRVSIALLAIGSAVIVSTTLVSHATAASTEAMVVDLIHNILASVWIGGVIALAFMVIPSISNKDSATKGYGLSLIIPRFSQLALLSVGVLGITGPLVLWGIESDIIRLLQSEYGMVLLAKLVLAALMVILGGYSTFKVHKRVVSVIASAKGAYSAEMDSIYSYTSGLLKLEACIGMALLLSVSLLTNTVPPEAYTISKLSLPDASVQSNSKGFTSIHAVEDAELQVSITPARVGINGIEVVARDSNGNMLDMSSVKVKVRLSNTDMSPVTYELSYNDGRWVNSNVIFPSNGLWSIEVNATRRDAPSISASIDAIIKPDLNEMRFDVKEYKIPYLDSIPLYPLYSREDNAIWVSDGNRASIWRFDLASKEFKEYTFNGRISTILARDSHARIWFIDPASRLFGYIDPSNGNANTFNIPYNALAIYIHVDSNDRIWLALADKGSIIMYNGVEDVNKDIYKEYSLPQGFIPTYITNDIYNDVWFTASTNNYGTIGRIVNEQAVLLDYRLSEPLAMHISSDGSIWVSEHVGNPARITYIDPLLGIVNSYNVIDGNALPYAILQDRLGNIWYAQHTVDKIGILDPHRGKIRDVDTLSKATFIQWIAMDDGGNVWYAASRAASIGAIKWSEVGVTNISTSNAVEVNNVKGVRYAEVFAPLLPILIASISFIYLRSASEYGKSLRRIKGSSNK